MESTQDSSSGRERIVRRLEAFSDIVIGVALAQTGTNLIVPERAEQVLSHPFTLFAFIVTFGNICLFWWRHSQVFRYYFEPNRTMILANFVFLASILLFIYALQLSLHIGSVTAFELYFTAQAVAFAFLAFMYGCGTKTRWVHLNVDLRSAGIECVVRYSGLVFGTAAGILALPHSLATMVLGVVAGAVIGRVAGRVLSRSSWMAAKVQTA